MNVLGVELEFSRHENSATPFPGAKRIQGFKLRIVNKFKHSDLSNIIEVLKLELETLAKLKAAISSLRSTTIHNILYHKTCYSVYLSYSKVPAVPVSVAASHP